MQKKLMLGNEAVARGLWECGVTVSSAYPGTPSTEISEFAAKYDEIYAEREGRHRGRAGRGCGRSQSVLRHEACRPQCGG